jgi:Glycosyl transferases group 1
MMEHDILQHKSSSRKAEDGSLMSGTQDDVSAIGRDDRLPSLAEKDKWPHFNLNRTMVTSRNSSTFPDANASDQVVSILILPQMPENKRKANSRHLIYDGIQQSRYLTFTDNVNDTSGNVVWLFDLLAGREEWATAEDETLWCPELDALIRNVQQARLARGQPVAWPLAIVDNRDFPIISTCPEIGNALGDENVRYSYRSAVKMRKWNASIPWVQSGILLDRESFPEPAVFEYRHRPIGVRTDTVQAIESLLNESYGLKLCHPIEELNRTIDISYFWELVNLTRRDSHLRDMVYKLLKNMERDRPDLNMMVGVRGQTAIAGRRKVSNVYVDTLLQSKIVVVTQRDHWEDQYRLFEAIVSGALVMTDRMLSLPRGLKDGESVVEYTSIDDLQSKLNYYLTHRDERLAIAKRGRFVAMSNHRSWLHMEEIIFGSPVTLCSGETGSACPYIVHAHQVNETC